MTRYQITAPEPRYNGDVAGLVFRAGEAEARTPGDLAAISYCQRRGYQVVAVDDEGEPLPDSEQPDTDTPGPDVAALTGDAPADPTNPGGPLPRPADYATKGEWVAYAIDRGASEEDAKVFTKNELVELYGTPEGTNS